MFPLDVNPFYERTTVCLPIPTLRNIYVVSSFSNYGHVGFCVNLSFQFTWVNTRSIIAGFYGKSVSLYEKLPNCPLE